MDDQTILPAPSEIRVPHGYLAEFYRDFSTETLVANLLTFHRPDPIDLGEDSKNAHAEGRASFGDLVIALHERGSRDVFEAARQLCLDGDPEKQIVGLWILKEIGPSESRPVFPETWNLLASMLRGDPDPEVYSWIVATYCFLHGPQAVDAMIQFSLNDDPSIRSSAAFAIVGCGLPNEERVVEVQLRLARDSDSEVRYYAIYDFTEVITVDSNQIREMLNEALDDEDEGIRGRAKEALEVRYVDRNP